VFQEQELCVFGIKYHNILYIMIRCEICQCNSTIFLGHWFLKYKDKRKGFGIKFKSKSTLPFEVLLSIFFPNYWEFIRVDKDYRGNNYSVICSFFAEEDEINAICDNYPLSNDNSTHYFCYNKYNCRHVLYGKIKHLLNETQKKICSIYLEKGELPILLMKTGNLPTSFLDSLSYLFGMEIKSINT